MVYCEQVPIYHLIIQTTELRPIPTSLEIISRIHTDGILCRLSFIFRPMDIINADEGASKGEYFAEGNQHGGVDLPRGCQCETDSQKRATKEYHQAS